MSSGNGRMECGSVTTLAMGHYRNGLIFNNMSIMLPWFSQLIDEDRRVLGDDWWPYGIEANRKAVDAFLALSLRTGSLEAPTDVRGHLRAGVALNVTPNRVLEALFAIVSVVRGDHP